MDDFLAIKNTLLRHLPRPSFGSLVSVSEEGVQIAAPGVDLGDLSKLLSDLTGSQSYLPEELPVSGFRLRSLSLERGDDGGVDLSFTVAWSDVSLSLADSFPLKVGKVEFSLKREILRASAEATLTVDGYDLKVGLEFPSQFFELRLDPSKAPAGLLEGRGLARSGATIREFTLRGSLFFKRLQLYVEIENLFSLGPVRLSYASAELDLAANGDSAASAAAVLNVDLPKGAELLIEVSGQVDSHGWRLSGGVQAAQVTISDLVNTFALSLKRKTIQLPDAIAAAAIKRVYAELDTHDQSFKVECALSWKHQSEFTVCLENSGGSFHVKGRLELADVTFQLDFEGGEVAVLSYEAAGSKRLSLDKLLSALSVDSGQALGPNGAGFDLNVNGAAIALDSQSRVLLVAAVEAGIDLSRLGDLPLVGSLLPSDEPLGLRLLPYFMADAFAAADETRKLLPASMDLPEGKLDSGIHLAATLHLGGAPISLDLTLADSPTAASGPAAPATPASSAATLPKGNSLTWKEINKSLGPLKLARAGYATDKKSFIDLAFDASLTIAGLTVSLDGLGARYEFSTRALTPRLSGLGLDLKRGPLEVGGGFLNDDGDFVGKLVISTESFSLNAIGAFKMLNGVPSMFAYGVLDMPLGGPAFFYVEGLAAGFGLHRSLHMPKVDQVRTFPLVANAGVAPAGEAKPMDELRKIHQYVSPQLGEYFLAVGIKFNSFRLLHGFALAVVSVGRDFEIDLVGTADYASPPELPKGVPAMAKIQLDLLARIVPAEGLVAVEARINPSSYVYSPLCHLSGGFAFYAWIGSAKDKSKDHNGDFVLCVGGYHPDFDKPSHYPVVPRFELKYQVTRDVYLKGNAYFALTPSAMMAGGGLHANVKYGSLHAWADLTVDFLLGWKPYHYDARIHLEIGAKWKCFHTTARADLHVWGPDFSGVASVDWWIFSFTIEFGSKVPLLSVPIGLDEFYKSFLDIKKDKAKSVNDLLGITLSSGVIGEVGNMPVVSPAELRIATSTRLPTLSAKLGGKTQAVLPAKIGISPCGLSSVHDSQHRIVVMRDGVDVSDEFKPETIEALFPPALWKPRSFFQTVDQNARPIKAVNGFRLKPLRQPSSGRTLEVSVGKRIQKAVVRAGVVRFEDPQVSSPAAGALPLGDLEALGLNTDELSYNSHESRPSITLGKRDEGGPIA